MRYVTVWAGSALPRHTTIRTGESRIDRLSQRTRRIIVIGALVGLPAMYLWSAYWLTTSVSNLVWGPVSFLLIGATIVGSLVLYRFVRDRADTRAGSLDERQRLLRDRALILSYGLLSAVVVNVVGVLCVLVFVFGRTITLDGALMVPIAITVGTLIPLVPIAALAWIKPDPLPQGE